MLQNHKSQEGRITLEVEDMRDGPVDAKIYNRLKVIARRRHCRVARKGRTADLAYGRNGG
jgi:hypothetical protein